VTAAEPVSTTILNTAEAPKPDDGTVADFKVQKNPFAFSPDQLSMLYNPKSLGVFHALGGLEGIAKGLRTDVKAGLSIDEARLDCFGLWEDTIKSPPLPRDSSQEGPGITIDLRSSSTPNLASSLNLFADRKRIFAEERLVERKPIDTWQLIRKTYDAKVLILLSAAVVVQLGCALYAELQSSWERRFVAATFAIIGISTVLAAWKGRRRKEEFADRQRQKEDRLAKAVRANQTYEILVKEILAGDVVRLEPGDIVVADGILVEGYNIKCDESSVTGESGLSTKTPGSAIHDPSSTKLDPFILSGSKVVEGLGTFLVTATGQRSLYGKNVLDRCEDSTHDDFNLFLQGCTDTWNALIIEFANTALSFITFLAEYVTDTLRESRLVRKLRSHGTLARSITTYFNNTGTPTQVTKRVARPLRYIFKSTINSTSDPSALYSPSKEESKLGTLLRQAIAVSTMGYGVGFVWVGSRSDYALLEFARKSLELNVWSERAKANNFRVWSGQKFVGSVLVVDGGYRLYVNGDAQSVFRHCSHISANDGSSLPLDKKDGSALRKTLKESPSRFIALAYKDFSTLPQTNEDGNIDVAAFLDSSNDLVLLEAFAIEKPITTSPGRHDSIETAQRSRALRRTRSVFLQRPSAIWMLLALFSPTVTAQSPNADVQPTWKRRSLAMLEEILVSCAFLVTPAIILILCLIIAIWFRYFKKETSAFFGMLCIAAVLQSIRAPSSNDGTDDTGIIRLATGFGYGMFMLVYCELVMLRNDGGKLFCFIASTISIFATLVLMAFALIRTYWLDRTKLDPFFALAIAIPLSFYLCDLTVHIIKQLNGHERVSNDSVLNTSSESSLPEGRRTSGLPYFDTAGLRSRSIFNGSYDSDPHELELGYLEAGLPPPATSQQDYAGGLLASIKRLLDKLDRYRR
jgi:hypothetical protein